MMELSEDITPPDQYGLIRSRPFDRSSTERIQAPSARLKGWLGEYCVA
jgi:hypothetical protein